MSEHDMKLIVAGAGGGGGKGGKNQGGKEEANTLQSNARARIAELLGEGPIEGIVDGLKNVYFDQTPVQNADGTLNFNGLKFEQRFGTPDQEHIPGLPLSETPFDVSTQVRQKVGPVTRTVVDLNADSVRVTLRAPAIVRYDDKGNITGSNLFYDILIRGNAGGFQTVVQKRIQNEKTTAPWQIDHDIELPAGQGPWDIRVLRHSPDEDDNSKNQNQLFWDSYTVVTRGKFTYPNTAYAFLEVNAEEFGSSLPARSYKVRGLKVQVPSNYDPVTRSYYGIWNGTFKIAWTSNPAWVFYDLVTNERYGLGEFVDSARVDKWTLYEIAKYCDELIPSGFKDASGGEIKEPRFTYNGVINTRDEAYQVLKNVTSAFRGMAFWALGQTYAVADIPTDPVKVVTPANVVGGSFKYSGTAKKARHSVAMVSWNDQNDFGRPAVELVINDEALQEFGWRETSIVKHGCTSRGEAHRFGKWILDTERNETETVTYTAGWDHADLKPFDIVAIADPAKALARAGGRLTPESTSRFKLDAFYAKLPGEDIYLTVTLPDGQPQRVRINSLTKNADGTATAQTATVSALPLTDSMYLISSVQLNPRQYRVLSVKETEECQFEITALFHDPTKYARVEYDLILDPIQYTRPGATVPPAKNLTASEFQYVENGVPFSKILFSWTPGSAFAVRHTITVDGPNGKKEFVGVTGTSLEVTDVVPGPYTFTIRSFGAGNLASLPAVLEYEAHGWAGNSDILAVYNLRTADGGPLFDSPDCAILWVNLVPGGQVRYKGNTVKVYAGDGRLLREEAIYGTTYTYPFSVNAADNASQGYGPQRDLRFFVSVTDVDGKASPESVLEASNPQIQTPMPQVQGGYYQAYLKWDVPIVEDYVGTIVWIEPEANFDPLTTTPKADTRSNTIAVPLGISEKLYVRIACYDTFGKDSLVISPPLAFTLLEDNVDVEEPEIPTGLTLKSEPQADGQARVTVEWNPHADPLVVEYGLEIMFGGGDWVSIPTKGAYYEFTCQPGTLIRARLRAYKSRGVFSGYSEIVEHIAAADEVPPAVPEGLMAKGSIKSIWFSWNANAEPDLLNYLLEIRRWVDPEVVVEPAPETDEPTDEDAPVEKEPEDPQVGTWVCSDNRYILVGTDSQAKYEARVLAVDTSGNKSEFSGWVTGETIKFDPVDYDVESAGVIKPVDALPDPITETTPKKVYLKPEREFYVQWTDPETSETIWLTDTDARLLKGQLSGDQIADETLLGSHISPGEISSTEIGNLSISTPKLRSEAVDARKIRADSIESRHIVAEAIGAREIAAESIGAEKIAADAILARHIKAEEINANHLTVDGAVITRTAQIGDAIIDDAKIVDLDAAKIKANSILAGSIKVDGSALSAIKQSADDPARAVNRGSTQIDPGKILISGGTTLSSWRDGGDTTSIAGGKIAANTITANKIKIGARGIVVEGIDFSYQNGYLSWSAGYISYNEDNGSIARMPISAGSFYTELTGRAYVWWVKGATTLSASGLAGYAQAVADDNVHMATYSGTYGIQVTYGGTIIDGRRIITGTVQAEQIAAGAITADKIQSGQINSNHIQSGSITTDKIRLGDITGNLLAEQAVTQSKIADGQIVERLVGLGAITGTKIAAGSISTPHILARAITADHLNVNTINADHINANSITTVKLTGGAVTNAAYFEGNGQANGALQCDGGLLNLWFFVDAQANSFNANSPGGILASVYFHGGLNHQRYFPFTLASAYEPSSMNQNPSYSWQVAASGFAVRGVGAGEGVGISVIAQGAYVRCFALNTKR